MAALFLWMAGTTVCVFFGQRKLAIGLLIVGLVFCWLMLWHHATDTLQIKL